eukprot:GHVL01010538.1.p1 GENE.GHVL01010538.1~~GHVL01010538.1.p1  ORF type:complete len:173 (+),score=14.70 GHVL01010538.1:23-541(+)
MSNDNDIDCLTEERKVSTIPCVNGTWFYPSERQFYSATLKKGHSVNPADIKTVVQIHNAVNEQTWKQILEYEKLHDCDNVKLAKFVGRPGEPTWKSRIYTFVGFQAPFDRHDWHIDRCGKQRRYIIDFYEGQSTPEFPVAIHIDARPDLFSLSGWIDRYRTKTTQLINYFSK